MTRIISLLIGALLMTHLAHAVETHAVRVLCLGDSLTEGYGLSKEAAWPAVLQGLLRAKGRSNVALVNAGVSGSTSASGLSRLKWHLKSKPTILVLALGANDGLRGVPVAETQKNLATIIKFAQQNGMKVLLAGMRMPPNYGKTYTADYEKMFRTLATDYKTAFMPFILEGVVADPALNLGDGIHPNAAGYHKIAENLLPYIESLL